MKNLVPYPFLMKCISYLLLFSFVIGNTYSYMELMFDASEQTIELFDFADAESETEENKTKKDRLDLSGIENLQTSSLVDHLHVDEENLQSLFHPETDTPPP